MALTSSLRARRIVGVNFVQVISGYDNPLNVESYLVFDSRVDREETRFPDKSHRSQSLGNFQHRYQTWRLPIDWIFRILFTEFPARDECLKTGSRFSNSSPPNIRESQILKRGRGVSRVNESPGKLSKALQSFEQLGIWSQLWNLLHFKAVLYQEIFSIAALLISSYSKVLDTFQHVTMFRINYTILLYIWLFSTQENFCWNNKFPWRIKIFSIQPIPSYYDTNSV